MPPSNIRVYACADIVDDKTHVADHGRFVFVPLPAPHRTFADHFEAWALVLDGRNLFDTFDWVPRQCGGFLLTPGDDLHDQMGDSRPGLQLLPAAPDPTKSKADDLLSGDRRTFH